MKCPAEIYTSSCRPYQGISEPHYPFHDKTVVVTNCGPSVSYRKKDQSQHLPGRPSGRHQGSRRRHLARQLHGFRSWYRSGGRRVFGGLKSTSRKVAWTPSARKGRADRPHVEKHLLWSRRRSTLDGHKPVSRIPADPIPISVGDDRATANFIGDAQADAERF